MTYEIVTYYSQMTALFLFLLLFAGSLVHAFWPGNKDAFRQAANAPLQNDDEIGSDGDRA